MAVHERTMTIEQIVKNLENNDASGDEVLWAGAKLREFVDCCHNMEHDNVIELWPDSVGKQN